MTVRSWQPGDVVLNLYEVLDVIDGGGMGLVHRVRHRGWNMDLAVKVPRPELVATDAGLSGFETEAATWVELGLHPNVVNCHYVRHVEQIPCVFAEWVSGGSLADLVRDGRLSADPADGPPARVLDMAVQIAWGIDHAHRQGVIHQDVKPANVMVDLDAGWTAKVTDFGRAGARAAAGERPGGPAGTSLLASYGGLTPAYCSPEQADAAAGARITLTRATDVWSWALCVLDMFTGGPPCQYGQTAPEVLAAFLDSGQPGARAMPASLADLLRRCFDIDPATRPRRLDELATAVIGIYADTVGAPYPRLPPQPANLLADGLSNQALSLLDLNRVEEAERLWSMAVDIDPHHPSARYNHALHFWRNGVLFDEEIVSELHTMRAVQGDLWQADHLLGLVHVERGDDDAARELLASAPSTPEVDAARAELERRGRLPKPVHLPAHRGEVTALAVDTAGEVAMTGGADGGVLVWALAEGHLRYELVPGAPEDATEDTAKVTAVAVSGDGRIGLSARGGDLVELWDLTDGTRLAELTGPWARVTAVAVTDSGTAAVTCDDGMVTVVNLSSRTTSGMLHFHPAPVTDVAISEDGDVAVSVSATGSDSSVVVWDVPRNQPLHRLITSADRRLTGLDTIALSRSGAYALLATEKGRSHVWETRTGQSRHTVRNLLSYNAKVALNDDATVAVSIGSGDSTEPLRIWETDSGRCLRTTSAQLEIWPIRHCDIAVSGNGRVVVLGGAYGGIQIHHLPEPGFRAGWSYARPRVAATLADTETQALRGFERAEEHAERGMSAQAAEELRTVRAIPGFARHPQLRARWEQLGQESGRRTVPLGVWRLYDKIGGTLTFTRKVSIGLSDDGDLAVTGGSDGLVRVWDLRTGEGLYAFPERVANTHTVLIAQDGLLAVTADWGGSAHLWDLSKGTRTCKLYGNQGRVKAISMDRGGRYALVGDDDGALCLWSLRPARLVRTMLAADHPIRSVGLSDDGRYAAATDPQTGTGTLWQTSTGSPLLTFPVNSGPTGLRFSPDSRRLFVCTSRQLTAWDLRSRREMYAIDSGFSGVVDDHLLAMSADGRIGVTKGQDLVRVWETATGRVLHELPGGNDAFDVTSDGGHVVTAGRDATPRLWDVLTGQCVHTLESHPARVSRLAFTSDGRSLVSTDLRPAIRVWEIHWDYDFTTGTGAR